MKVENCIMVVFIIYFLKNFENRSCIGTVSVHVHMPLTNEAGCNCSPQRLVGYSHLGNRQPAYSY